MSDTSATQFTEGTPPLKDGEQSFGSFFPKNYVLAVFSDAGAAEQAGNALAQAGFAADDIIVASGEDVAEHDAQVRAERGVLAKLGEKWSRLYTDEARDADALMEIARKGATFVLAYAPDEETTERATVAIRPTAPDIFRKYDSLKVTELGLETE